MDADRPLKITEIFHSIQGESSFAGRPCVFVRLTGCNLRCSYCDTTYAFTGGSWMTVDEVLATVRTYPCKLVEITGGEPLLQPSVFPLMSALCDERYEVLLETSGSRPIDAVDARVISILDVKCPSSLEADHNLWTNLERLREQDEIKFVVADRHDYEYAKTQIHRFGLDRRGKMPLLSPCFGKLEPRLLTEWMLKDGLHSRLQLQLHKIIWDPQARGV